jgi:hypothetical protein
MYIYAEFLLFSDKNNSLIWISRFDLIAKTQNLTAYKPGFGFELGKFFKCFKTLTKRSIIPIQN